MNAGVGYVGLACTTDAGRRTVSSGVPQPPSLLKALWTTESQVCKRRPLKIIVTVASPLSNTSRTESRCLASVESSLTREETDCRTHQLEVIVCGEQRWATNASMQHVLLSCARAEACSRLTGDAAWGGSNALLAAVLVRSVESDGADSLRRYVVLSEALALRSMPIVELVSALLRPRSLLVLTHGVAKPGSHRSRGCSNNDSTFVNLQTRGPVGAAARSVRLPTRRSTAGARVRPLLLAAKMGATSPALNHFELMSSVALSKTDRHGSS